MMIFTEIMVIVICAALGVAIFSSPKDAIEVQRRFYELINWRIEPISMEREVRNTRVMGLLLILAAIGTVIYIIFFQN